MLAEAIYALVALTFCYLIFHFLVIRPERQEEFARREQVRILLPGWHIETQWGLIGTVEAISSFTRDQITEAVYRVRLANTDEAADRSSLSCLVMSEAIHRTYPPGQAPWLILAPSFGATAPTPEENKVPS